MILSRSWSYFQGRSYPEIRSVDYPRSFCMPTKNKLFFWFFLLISYCRYIYISLQRYQVIKKSGSWRPKNLRIRFRIRNTAHSFCTVYTPAPPPNLYALFNSSFLPCCRPRSWRWWGRTTTPWPWSCRTAWTSSRSTRRIPTSPPSSPASSAPWSPTTDRSDLFLLPFSVRRIFSRLLKRTAVLSC